jgi:hypothetical protein
LSFFFGPAANASYLGYTFRTRRLLAIYTAAIVTCFIIRGMAETPSQGSDHVPIVESDDEHDQLISDSVQDTEPGAL